MIPKKAIKFCNQVAEELNTDTSLVEDLIEFYYKEVRQLMTDLVHPRIDLEGLGHFVVKENLIKKTIPKLEKSLKTHDTSTFNAYFTKKGKEVTLEQLLNMQLKLQQEAARKENFITNKNEKYSKNNLGE